MTCLETNLNVGRLWGSRIVIVAATITVLSNTGCASIDAPPSAISLADVERLIVAVADDGLDVAGNVLLARWFAQDDPLDSPSVGYLFSVVNSATNVRRSGAREAPFQPAWPVYVDDDVLTADTGAGVGALADEHLPTLISFAVDTEPAVPDRQRSASSTDLLLDSAAVVPWGYPQVFAIDGPPSSTPPGALVLPVIGSTLLTVRGNPWPGVMKASAGGFLAAILLVPFGCSFAAGAVCRQPRAGPRARHPPSCLLADLTRAIANVPAH